MREQDRLTKNKPEKSGSYDHIPESETPEKSTLATNISQEQYTDVFKTSVLAAAENFLSTWNSRNPNNKIGIRFIPGKVQIQSHPTLKAQATLSFEMQRSGVWQVMSRTTVNLRSVKDLEAREVQNDFELWMKMFDEITKIGFSAVVNYLHGKESNQRSAPEGNLKAVEDEGPESL